MSDWYTGADSVVGSGIRVVPPSGWPLGPGRPPQAGGGWSVGGVSYRTWGEAWRSAVRPSGWRDDRRAPTASAYLRAWSVDPSVEFAWLKETVTPPVVQVVQTVQVVQVQLRRGRDAHVGQAVQVQLQEVRGIDLAKRGHEVRKLLYAGFGFRMARAGYDPEEVLQEVYRGILVRNQGKCPFDGQKSSFGHYVHMVISCVLSNYHRKMSKHRSIEGSWEDLAEGVRGFVSEGGSLTGGLWGRSPDEETDEQALSVLSARVRSSILLSEVDRERALLVLPLVQRGYAPTVRGAREAGWSDSEWRAGVLALRRVLGG